MPAARRPSLRLLALGASCAAVLSLGLAPAGAEEPVAAPGEEPAAAPAEEPAATPTAGAEEAPVAGERLVGELVQGYTDPAPDERRGSPGAHGGAELLSWIETAPGEGVRVLTEDLGDVAAGATVEVTLGEAVVDVAAAEGLQPAAEVLATEVIAPPPPDVAPAAGTVNHPVTVVMARPAGSVQDTTTLDDVVRLVDGPVAGYWAEQSGGVARFGVVAAHDWPAQASAIGCDDPLRLFQEAATRAGWTSGPGRHLLLYVPDGSPGCSYGLGTIGQGVGSGGLAYVQAPELSVTAHEFGHNLGLGHASQVQCDGQVDAGACRLSEYYDLYDVMGISWGEAGSLGAPHAARLGVLPPGSTVGYAAGSAPVEVTLAPVGARSGVRAARLTDASGEVYWLEYRAATGRDAWLGTPANWPGLQAGVLLRLGAEGDHTSLLMDLTPSSRAGWDADLAAAAPLGRPVTIAGGSLSVTLLEAGATGARLRLGAAHPVDALYDQRGGPASLGTATTGLVCGLRDGGCFRHYQRGSIYWSPRTGARIVDGAVRDRWASLRWETGRLGYPVTDTRCGLVARGCYQHFQGGSLYVSESTAVHLVAGAIRDVWAASGWEAGRLGYPVTDEVCGLRGGGCFQHYQRGSVYWSPATGARIVDGPVRDRWASLGWEAGRLGYPVTDTRCGLVARGCYQHFQGGSLYVSESTAVHPVVGAIRDVWAASGWEAGRLGYPVTDEICGLRGGGCFQHYQRGSIYWSPGTGAHAVAGPIRDAWAAQGWENGRLGYPVGGARPVPGGEVQPFQGGSLQLEHGTGRVRRV